MSDDADPWRRCCWSRCRRCSTRTSRGRWSCSAEYGKHGAFGLVVNRQMAEPAHEVIRTEPPIDIRKDVHCSSAARSNPMRAWVLTADRELDGEALEVADGVYLSASPEPIRHALQSPPEPRMRLVVGYAGLGARASWTTSWRSRRG